MNEAFISISHVQQRKRLSTWGFVMILASFARDPWRLYCCGFSYYPKIVSRSLSKPPLSTGWSHAKLFWVRLLNLECWIKLRLLLRDGKPLISFCSIFKYDSIYEVYFKQLVHYGIYNEVQIIFKKFKNVILSLH